MNLAENEIDEFSFWDDCGREAKRNPAPGRSHGNSTGGGHSGGGGGVPKRKGDKEEVSTVQSIMKLLSLILRDYKSILY